jgi:putative endonuclease
METDKKFFVYIILTVTNKLYCGYTDDVEKRYKLHCSGKGAKFTRANKPAKLVYVQEFDSKTEAQREEYRIKHLTREKKLELINTNPRI